ncbi:MAG: hypothetical protein VKN33_02045 [Candidatus Sericytochromatia bacterium]|nr:hypothetical protein [Candidatus Sericytochromatia bacterium]
MADAHSDFLHELFVRLQDGTTWTLRRNEEDCFILQDRTPAGSALRGFGPWPSWDANRRQSTLTEPDEDSGLFEPERLFVLREQYMFLSPPGESDARRFLSLGPIDRAWWAGSESIVQARQRSAKH